MNKKIRAKRIWKAVFDCLYDRSEFDWWWDDIQTDIRREIKDTMIGIILKQLKEK